MPLIHRLAVTARSVKLSEILNSEIGDRDNSSTVVLNNLIRSAKSSTALDRCGSASGLDLDGESVFADCGPLDVGECAGTLAVDTLDLVGAGDDVGEGVTFFDVEDCVGVAAFRLACARDPAVEHDHAAVERPASCDGLSGDESRSARGSWESLPRSRSLCRA
jgi:hypothetical protein